MVCMLIVIISGIDLVLIWQEGGSQVGVTGNGREGVWEGGKECSGRERRSEWVWIGDRAKNGDEWAESLTAIC